MLENLSNILQEEVSTKSIKDRLDWKTVGKTARKIRNASGTLSMIFLALAKIPINSIPENFVEWCEWAAIITGAIAGTAHLDKSGKLPLKK